MPIDIGDKVEWGPEAAPLGSGVVRYLLDDGRTAYIRNGEISYRIPVAVLRKQEVQDGNDLQVRTG